MYILPAVDLQSFLADPPIKLYSSYCSFIFIEKSVLKHFKIYYNIKIFAVNFQLIIFYLYCLMLTYIASLCSCWTCQSSLKLQLYVTLRNSNVHSIKYAFTNVLVNFCTLLSFVFSNSTWNTNDLCNTCYVSTIRGLKCSFRVLAPQLKQTTHIWLPSI